MIKNFIKVFVIAVVVCLYGNSCVPIAEVIFFNNSGKDVEIQYLKDTTVFMAETLLKQNSSVNAVFAQATTGTLIITSGSKQYVYHITIADSKYRVKIDMILQLQPDMTIYLLHNKEFPARIFPL